MISNGAQARPLQHFWLVGAVAAALALRFWHIAHGLPDFLEEAYPFRIALEMWGWNSGRTDWNPHFFSYPSVSIYLNFLVQKLGFVIGHLLGAYPHAADYRLAYDTDPTSMVVAARVLSVAFDGLTVWCVGVIGERLGRGVGIVAATLVAFSPTLLLTSREIFSDTPMLALALAALERMLAWRERGGLSRLAAAAVLIGLATGAKYPAGLLALPLGWVMFERLGRRGLVLWPALLALAAAAFFASSPYAVLDFGAFVKDFRFEAEHAAAGHFGNAGQRAALFHLRHLAQDLGVFGVVLLPVSLALTLARARRAGVAIALWLFVLPTALTLALARSAAERHLLPVIAVGAMLSASAALRLGHWLSARLGRWATPALLALLVAQPLFEGGRAAASGGNSTQVEGRRWLEAHLGERELLVEEGHGVELLGQTRVEEVKRSRAFEQASETAKRRFLARRSWFVEGLPLFTQGVPLNAIERKDAPPRELAVFDDVSGFNRIFYDPRLLAGADYFLTSSAVRGRYEAESPKYREELALYALLDRTADLAAEFKPHGLVTGPTLRIYHLGERTRAALDGVGALLPPLWWADAVSPDYRRRFDELVLPPAERSGGAVTSANGFPSLWVLSLRGIFLTDIRPFLYSTALDLAELGRFSAAERFATAILAMVPDDAPACMVFTSCAVSLDQWPSARAAFESTLEHLRGGGQDELLLRFEYAQLLLHEREPDRARHELEHVITSAPQESEIAARARISLGEIVGALRPAR